MLWTFAIAEKLGWQPCHTAPLSVRDDSRLDNVVVAPPCASTQATTRCRRNPVSERLTLSLAIFVKRAACTVYRHDCQGRALVRTPAKLLVCAEAGLCVVDNAASVAPKGRVLDHQ